MSLLFNTLCRFVIAFLPRSKYLLISWLQSPSTVILEPKKIKSVTVSIVSPSICNKVMGPDAKILVFFSQPRWMPARRSLGGWYDVWIGIVVESGVTKHTWEDTQDSGVQFIIPVGPRVINSQQGRTLMILEDLVLYMTSSVQLLSRVQLFETP